MTALRSCRVVTMRISVAPGWASSRSTIDLGNDAEHLAARSECRVRGHAHEADAAAAVDEADPAPGETLSDGPRERRVRRVVAGRRAAEHADAAHQYPSVASFRLMRRAARARCEISFFSAALHSPSVRPPGGSEAGSKIGS